MGCAPAYRCAGASSRRKTGARRCVALPSSRTVVSRETGGLETPGYVRGRVGPGSGESMERIPPRYGGTLLWLAESNYDAGVLPAFSFVNGSQESPCDPHFILLPCSNQRP